MPTLRRGGGGPIPWPGLSEELWPRDLEYPGLRGLPEGSPGERRGVLSVQILETWSSRMLWSPSRSSVTISFSRRISARLRFDPWLTMDCESSASFLFSFSSSSCSLFTFSSFLIKISANSAGLSWCEASAGIRSVLGMKELVWGRYCSPRFWRVCSWIFLACLLRYFLLCCNLQQELDLEQAFQCAQCAPSNLVLVMYSLAENFW